MVEGASVKWAIPEKIKQQGLSTYFVNHRPAPPPPPILPPLHLEFSGFLL